MIHTQTFHYFAIVEHFCDLGTCLRVSLESEDIDPDKESDSEFWAQTPIPGVVSVQRTFPVHQDVLIPKDVSGSIL